MLQIIADALLIAARVDREPYRHEVRLPNPQHEENRRRAWSLISGLRL